MSGLPDPASGSSWKEAGRIAIRNRQRAEAFRRVREKEVAGEPDQFSPDTMRHIRLLAAEASRRSTVEAVIASGGHIGDIAKALKITEGAARRWCRAA